MFSYITKSQDILLYVLYLLLCVINDYINIPNILATQSAKIINS